MLVDGRSVYLDFFGLVLWDFVPNATSGDIKQIEVVRGPASVVWGANALTGVVNVITKSPRENEGFGVNLGGGLFSRDGGSREATGAGCAVQRQLLLRERHQRHLVVQADRGLLRLRPVLAPGRHDPPRLPPARRQPLPRRGRQARARRLPGRRRPVSGGAAGAGNWREHGTSQPKVDLRVDQELTNGGRITYQGGYAGTDGIIHTGHRAVRHPERLLHGLRQGSSTRRTPCASAPSANFVDANAPNLLQTDPDTLQPVVLGFKTQTYDLEVGNSNVLGGKHILTYGGNYRRNNFDITLAPGAQDRNEIGAYLQEEFFVSKLRLAAGVRADKFGNLDHWVFSPRLSVMFKPTPDQSIRASYNRAFRSPSVINNYLDQNISTPQPTDLRPLAGLLPPSLRPLVPASPSS